MPLPELKDAKSTLTGNGHVRKQSMGEGVWRFLRGVLTLFWSYNCGKMRFDAQISSEVIAVVSRSSGDFETVTRQKQKR